MSEDSTRWTVIQRAAQGSAQHRDEFARRYDPVIRECLAARWRRTPLSNNVDDAVQETFIECFKEGGALERADPDRGAGFRAFLYGIVRNVARRCEHSRFRRRERQPDSACDLEAFEADDEPLSGIFDRAWGRAVIGEAARLQLARAREKGERAIRRHRLLELRYGEGLPIRDIAARWEVDPAFLHGQFRQAREEFRRALRETVRTLNGGAPESVDAECRRLMRVFS